MKALASGWNNLRIFLNKETPRPTLHCPTHCLGRGARELFFKHFANWNVRSFYRRQLSGVSLLLQVFRACLLCPGIITQVSVAPSRGTLPINLKFPTLDSCPYLLEHQIFAWRKSFTSCLTLSALQKYSLALMTRE